ncbi:hypothetical protein FRZ67_19210 [Panacibacter ginsenosidivorans]|uniref:Uncharacterized protein n=1 Tax=Panacibacter ginsenosidivorans TaxID=1813871 RepID=A0A5B8VE80_9BACT|nr:hypothetical protein [Panacibacter ginsenosidivorans]QEC69333.1 hypothetical protein FRZ67_19210 [Panacibacter ginsenosidivorans]
MEIRTITVHDGSKYFYTTSAFTAANPLGIVKATLIEYALYKPDNKEAPIGKLYKTNEGNWYDAPTDDVINTLLSASLKKAIDEAEKIHSATEVHS